jgi:NodT family efflux transporter outer membrane factor (OMF) lipoprotein
MPPMQIDCGLEKEPWQHSRSVDELMPPWAPIGTCTRSQFNSTAQATIADNSRCIDFDDRCAMPTKVRHMTSHSPRLRCLGLFASLLSVLLASGCTSPAEFVRNGFKVGPNYARPPAQVAPQWIDADDVRVRSDTDDLSQWWKVFNDPVLDDLICHAYRQNLSLREAGFRVLQARAQYGYAIGEIFPQTQNATGNYTRTATSITAITGGSFGSAFGTGGSIPPFAQYFGMLNSNFNLAWELDFWGRFRRAIEGTGADLDASVEGYNDVLVTLLGDVATNYVQLRVLQLQIELLHENVRLQRESVRIAQARFDLGGKTELDLAQAKTTLDQTLAQIPQKEITVRQVTNRLCVLLGVPPTELASRLAKRTIPDAPKEVVAGIPADLLRRRPDVRRAERQAAAESARIGVAVAQLYPHISIIGSFGWQAPNLNQLFTPLAFQGSYAPSFQWDLLNYGRLWNNIKYQKFKFQEVVTTYQNKVLSAAEEVENGMVMYLKAQEEVKYLAESVVEAKKALRIGVEEFKAGRVDFNRVAVLEQNLVQQDTVLAQARGDVALGLVQVYRALGGGWQIGCQDCPTSGPFPPAPVEPDAPAKGVDARLGQALLGAPTER